MFSGIEYVHTPNDSEIFLRAPNVFLCSWSRKCACWERGLLHCQTSSLSRPLIAPSALLRLAADMVPTVGFFVIGEYFGVVLYSNYLRGHVVPSAFGKEKRETLEN